MGCCDAPGLMPISDAINQMLSTTKTLPDVESLDISNAVGRILSTPVQSPLNVPPFDNSAMDGYAVRIHDLENQTILPLAGQSFAGHPFTGHWEIGTCIRIMTGAQIPEGCDAVVMQEDVSTTEEGHVSFDSKAIKRGQNIRQNGNDISIGSTVFNSGHKLTLRDLPILASLGIATVSVFQKVKVAIFSTGDEIKSLDEPLKAGEIYDSNRYGLIPLFEKFGAEVIDLGIIVDDKTAIKETFDKAQQCADIVITSGGVSVGEADYTKDILEEMGEIGFWKIAIKPGKPFAFGQLPNAFFCGLPGNPVSAAITAHVLVEPFLAKMSGHSEWTPDVTLNAKSLSAFKKRPGRTDYQRGIYRVENGEVVVESCANQSSGAFMSMSIANCYVILEQERGSVTKGETVTIQPFGAALL
ncbi:molybdenum cofactor biosynthesis protein MoaA (plasmid) [Vibrio sp. qd031]|uniref:molybdopterin molybdotransferase MoeA n=1 Tax=Vibrio sp. qd031 TaxID=1603038 RepID=UPI000A116BAB|nr:molybdopterin molybdotransferase MoeA [Vibrio sp. qd031]ORT52565.1 molybdenum cofactor biosynthesis protein MoaA [Vibrio sp. qd031]